MAKVSRSFCAFDRGISTSTGLSGFGDKDKESI